MKIRVEQIQYATTQSMIADGTSIDISIQLSEEIIGIVHDMGGVNIYIAEKSEET